MTTSTINATIDAVLPRVERPPIDKIVVHSEGCRTCEFLLRDFLAYKDSSVTPELLLRLCDDQSALTPEAYRWILPEYLKAVIDEEAHDMVRDYFLYHLSPTEKYFEETRVQLGHLTEEELNLMRQVLFYLKTTGFWLDDELSKALSFLEKIRDGEHTGASNGLTPVR